MKSILIKSLPFKEVIFELAQAFGTSMIEDCEEYSLHIPVEFGEGKITGVNFNEGLGLLLYDCTFNEDLEIKFIVNEVHPLKFLFCENGSLSHRFENEKNVHTIEQFQNAIVASREEHGHIIQFKANKRTCINSLEIDREKFQPHMHCELKNLGTSLESLFRDVRATKVFYKNGDYCLKLADLFQEISDYPQANFLQINTQVKEITWNDKYLGERYLGLDPLFRIASRGAEIIGSHPYWIHLEDLVQEPFRSEESNTAMIEWFEGVLEYCAQFEEGKETRITLTGCFVQCFYGDVLGQFVPWLRA